MLTFESIFYNLKWWQKWKQADFNSKMWAFNVANVAVLYVLYVIGFEIVTQIKIGRFQLVIFAFNVSKCCSYLYTLFDLIFL